MNEATNQAAQQAAQQAELTKTNSVFKYTSGSNAQAIWRKYGWTPPSEYRTDYLFKHNREAQGEA